MNQGFRGYDVEGGGEAVAKEHEVAYAVGREGGGVLPVQNDKAGPTEGQQDPYQPVGIPSFHAEKDGNGHGHDGLRRLPYLKREAKEDNGQARDRGEEGSEGDDREEATST